MAIISAGTTTQLRRVFDSLLAHTYARTVVTEAGGYYGDEGMAGATTTAQPCRYRAQDRLRTDDGARVIVSTPTITVPHNDPIVSGDLVSDVRDSNGVLLFAGPAAVETVEASAGLGPTLQKRAVLRAGDAV